MADRTTRRRLWRRGIIAGVVAAVLVLCAGVGWSLRYKPSYTATATLLVLPNAKSSQTGDAASYYDTLSQGQIVETFAQVLRAKSSPVWVVTAGPGLTTAQVARTGVTVTAVPGTSIISITAQGTDPAIAERVVEAMATISPHELNVLATPYRALTVDSGAGSAQKSGVDIPALLAAVVAVAVLAGVGTQQLTWLLGNASLRAAQRDRREGFGYDTTGFPIVADDDARPDPDEPEHAEPEPRRRPRLPRRPEKPGRTAPRANPVGNGSGGTARRVPESRRDDSHPYQDG
ncbi:MAG TPA: Wzz/FepE/Etk N-terminal domain-containing protein [Streptosporangiaceae bacterium]|jgi:capsular polysaccharide biosynthesis protein